MNHKITAPCPRAYATGYADVAPTGLKIIAFGVATKLSPLRGFKPG